MHDCGIILVYLTLSIMQKPLADHLIVGKFGKTRGLDGWIRVHSFTDPSENILKYQPWTLPSGETVTYRDSQCPPGKVFALLEGIDTIDDASLYIGLEISIPKAALPKLPEGEHYWFELSGLTVVNTNNTTLGVCEYVTPGSQFPLIVVKRAGKPDLLVPHEPSVVKKVDTAAQTLLVDWDDF